MGDSQGLSLLLSRLSALGYQFTTVTPETHALVNARPANGRARTVRDVFGWNRRFTPDVLPEGLFELAVRAGACQQLSDGSWQATVRVASVAALLFAHSAFPTIEQDAVFFGPDSYRFARAIRHLGAKATRAVDVGCGSGVGGIVLSQCADLAAPVVLADINDRALELARLNALAAGVSAEVVHSDVLQQVEGKVDLIIANPPYLVDPGARAYRHGGDAHGAALSARIVKESLRRLDRDGGGSLLVYTGVAMLPDSDPFRDSIEDDLQQSGAIYHYEELDPDVFASDLRAPSYSDVERIAVVTLRATLRSARSAGQ